LSRELSSEGEGGSARGIARKREKGGREGGQLVGGGKKKPLSCDGMGGKATRSWGTKGERKAAVRRLGKRKNIEGGFIGGGGGGVAMHGRGEKKRRVGGTHIGGKGGEIKKGNKSLCNILESR